MQTEGKDSFEVVKEFLGRAGERSLERGEVLEIKAALEDIHARLMRVRSIAPTVDLSERMWSLMQMVGIQAKPVRTTGFGKGLRSAASFL
jgi:hypothetical protein